MMYAFMTLDDETEIVHSNIIMHDQKENVKVYFEKPIEGGFKSGTCYLPDYRWEDIVGFSEEDINKFNDILQSTSHLIIRFARQGGLGNASNL